MQIEENVDFKKVVVNKPWGYEYMLYENDSVSLWALHINPDQSTSLHCHSRKTTGLVTLSGRIEVNFLENNQILEPMQKVMIRETLFHSEKCISEKPAVIIELETPVDKDDLIRLSDSYGRENKRYEGEEKYSPRSSEHIILSEDRINTFFDHEFEFVDVKTIEDLFYLNDDDICLLLEGSFNNKVNNRELCVVKSGDCFYGRVYKKIFSTIHSCHGVKALIIRRAKE